MQVNAQSEELKPKSEDAPTENEEGVTLNFQNTDIHALINMVSEVTGRNFVVDPRVKAKVTLYSGSELDNSQIYEVFLSVLDVHNLSAIEVGDITKVVPVASSKQLPLPTSYDQTTSSTISPSDDLVTQVYKLKHATAAEILPIVRPLIPPESHVAVHARSDTLIFTDTESNVKRILGILNYLDVADAGVDFSIRIIPIKFSVASKLKGAIDTLLSDIVGGGSDGANKKAIIYADDGSKSLIINSSDEAFAIISSVVASLDIETFKKTQDIHTVRLKYAQATEMSTILSEVAQRLSPTKVNPNGGSNDFLSVQVHEASNTLIIYANEADFVSMQTVIDQLDVRPKQVFIEAIIAEVSFSKAADLGINLSGNVDVAGGGIATTEFSGVQGGLSVNIINELVLNSAGAVVPDLRLILGALKNDSSTNILSTPNLLTVDNETAEIVVGQEVPFVTGQFTAAEADAATVQSIERRDVGLTLTVTPRVNTDNLVTMVVEQETSNVSARLVAGASDVVTDERRISATVQAESGKIIVMGGLIRDDLLKAKEEVPILGRIPIIGNLFKRRSDQISKTNLMVFLRPTIIDGNADISSHTEKKYNYIRDLSVNQIKKDNGLLSYEDVGTLKPFYGADDPDNPQIVDQSAELIEAIWRYALPESEYKTESAF